MGVLWLLWARNSLAIATWAAGDVNGIANAGAWGDSFGAFSAFFGAIGFAGVIVTLVQQGAVIKQQQEEVHRQRFEATYFELLELLRAARSEVRFRQSEDYRLSNKSSRKKSSLEEGPGAFRAAMFEFKFWLSREEIPQHRRTAIDVLGRLYRKRVHQRYESTFGPYFRLLYTILWRLKEDKKLSSEERRRYANLLRAQLTSFEVGLAGFNGLMEQAKNLDELLTDFRMLKYYPSGEVRKALEKVYLPKAFQGSQTTSSASEMLEIDPLETGYLR
ncbi:putative phage abortive infection protein [Rhizobium sp. Rhizsp82]|uniref:putative phage abortive infection protein n=1 Tax=Rhizobium sp. Rhizsp82 TaxID=3243057 RepID=UPI0039B6AAB0